MCRACKVQNYKGSIVISFTNTSAEIARMFTSFNIEILETLFQVEDYCLESHDVKVTGQERNSKYLCIDKD